MRITHNTITNQSAADLQKNMRRLEQSHTKVSSRRKINRPSDDPIEAERSLGYRKRLGEITQHLRNIDDASAHLNQTEAVLNEANNSLIRLKDLTLQMASDTVSEKERASAAAEVRNIKEHLLQLSNTKLGGQYIFAGGKTSTRPFEELNGKISVLGGCTPSPKTKIEYRGDTTIRLREIDVETTIPINIPGSQIFGTSTSGIFASLSDLEKALNENSIPSISECLDDIDAYTETIITARARIASWTNRAESTRDSLQEIELNVTKSLSQTEDVDLVEAITELLSNDNAYKAALASTARVIRPSLLDFLG